MSIWSKAPASNGAFDAVGDLPRRVLLALCVWLMCVLPSGCKSDNDSKKSRPATPSQTLSLSEFFADGKLHPLQLELAPEAMAALRSSPRDYVQGSLTFEGKRYAISIKLKGNRSFRKLDNKPALKLRFDKQEKTGRFLGLRRLTLNNMVDDPSRMREFIGYALYRAAGVAAPRTAYSWVTLNGEDYGIYLAIEAIDAEFAKNNFGEPIGGLYEAEYGCDLYVHDVEKFERDEGPKESREQLAALSLATQTPAKTLLTTQSAFLAIPEIISFLAVSTLIGDFDGYWHSHNYYLYQNGPMGKWHLVPWGIDRAFNDRVNLWGSKGRLAQLCFADSQCRVSYAKRLLEVAELMESLQLNMKMRDIFAVLGPAANRDPRDGTDEKLRLKKRRRMRDFLKKRPSAIRKAISCIGEDGEIDPDDDGFGCADCDGSDAAVHPGAKEVCDGVDNNCSGFVDDAPQCPCETLTVGATEFHLCLFRKNWKDAGAFCSSKGLSLAYFDSPAQSKAVLKAALELDDNRWWLGASDQAEEGNWVWTDGRPVGAGNWGKDQPNNNQCGQDCASLDAVEMGGKWVDSHCEQHYPFVCR